MSVFTVEQGIELRRRDDAGAGGSKRSVHQNEHGRIYRCGPDGPKYFGEGRKARRRVMTPLEVHAASDADESAHLEVGKDALRKLAAYAARDIDEDFRHPETGADLLQQWRRPAKIRASSPLDLPLLQSEAPAPVRGVSIKQKTWCLTPRLVPQLDPEESRGHAIGALQPILEKDARGRYGPLQFVGEGVDKFDQWQSMGGAWCPCERCEGCTNHVRGLVSNRMGITLADPTITDGLIIHFTVADEMLQQLLLPAGEANDRDFDLSLIKPHLDKYFAEIRRKYPVGIKPTFEVSKFLEAGGEKGRLHAHVLIFMRGGKFPLPEMVPLGSTFMVGSKKIEQRRGAHSGVASLLYWKHWPYGFVAMERVNMDDAGHAANYVCKYIAKDVNLFADDVLAYPGVIRTRSRSPRMGVNVVEAEARRTFALGLPPNQFPFIWIRRNGKPVKAQMDEGLQEAFVLEFERLDLEAHPPTDDPTHPDYLHLRIDEGVNARQWVVATLKRARQRARNRKGGEFFVDIQRKGWTDPVTGKFSKGAAAGYAYAARMAKDAALKRDAAYRAPDPSGLALHHSTVLTDDEIAAAQAAAGFSAAVSVPVTDALYSVVDADRVVWLAARTGWGVCPVLRWRRDYWDRLVIDVTGGNLAGRTVPNLRAAVRLLAEEGLPPSARRVAIDHMAGPALRAARLARAEARVRALVRSPAEQERSRRRIARRAWEEAEGLRRSALTAALSCGSAPDG